MASMLLEFIIGQALHVLPGSQRGPPKRFSLPGVDVTGGSRIIHEQRQSGSVVLVKMTGQRLINYDTSEQDKVSENIRWYTMRSKWCGKGGTSRLYNRVDDEDLATAAPGPQALSIH